MVVYNNILAGASGATTGAAGDYEISRSLRFNSGDSSYLSRTPSSAGNRKTWTWAGWVKRSKLGSEQALFGAWTDDSNRNICRFNSSDQLQFLYQNSGTFYGVTTNQVFRDSSAWYHLVLVLNTSDTTEADRAQIYVNGSRIADSGLSSFGSGKYPPQNTDYTINNTAAHHIGARKEGGALTNTYGNDYLADVHFIDGQALAPTDFGQYDNNNVWQPKEYSGTYGTNGFNLDFSDPSDLGNDKAGSNDWTPNNLIGSAGLATANQGFDVVTYTGSGPSDQAITGLNFQPDFVWIKTRNEDENHFIVDSVRGVTNQLYANQPGQEYTNANRFKSFDSNGFTVGSTDDTNQNGNTFVAWAWKADGAASSNTDGTITSSVSANNTYGFSVVSYTGETGAQTVGHGLSSAPKFIIAKNRDRDCDWIVYHESLDSSNPEDKFLRLNEPNNTSTSADYWGSGGVTNSVFGVDNGVFVNIDGEKVIAYCWSEVSGFSKFGSYSGSTSDVTITTGFKPRYILIKSYDTASQEWIIKDDVRGDDKYLEADTADQEGTGRNVTFNSDGFTLAHTEGPTNYDGRNYIYAAFAAKPDESIIDSLIDTPTNITADSGNNPGNYATLNPLDSTLGSNLTNGNLDAAGSSSWSAAHVRGTIGVTSGKYYWEVTRTGGSGGNAFIGFGNKAYSLTESFGSTPANSWLFNFSNGTEIVQPNAGGSGYFSGSGMGVGDTVGIALDMDNQTAVFYKNGTAGASISLSSTKTASTDNITELFPIVGVYNANVSFNAGQRPFAHTPPTGFLPLVTTSLPDPTIADGSDYFEAKLYTGNGTSQTISGLGFSPDFVWTKLRSAGFGHRVWDTVRGATKRLEPHDTSAEATESTALTAFTSDGFSVGSEANVNTTHLGGAFVAWCWDAGSSTATNTDGSITSSVRANPSAGFSIVSYTGTGNSGTIGHGLNAAPHLVIVKERDTPSSGTSGWMTYHNGVGDADKYLRLEGAGAAQTASTVFGADPTASVFSIGDDREVSDNTKAFIAYCFAPVDQYSSFGSFQGNNSADGPFVYTEMKPRWILFKNASIASNWLIYDTARDTYNVADKSIQADEAQSETNVTSDDIDILSNGFKIRTTRSDINGDGNTIVYACFAEHPMKHSRAR